MRWESLIGFGLGLAGALTIARGVANSKQLVVVRETVYIPDLPPAFEGFRLLHLTDVHLSRHHDRTDELLEHLAQVTPDLVCLGGDYVFTALSLSVVERFLTAVSARYPTIGILGNADYRPDIGPDIKRRWANIFPLLINASHCVQRQADSLWFAGVNDPHKGFDDLPAALAAVPPVVPVILLAHSPDVILRPLDPRIRLILTGHTHGGQICLPGGKALYHNTHLTAKYAAGRHEIHGATLYVSRGIGSTRLPLRYHCVPEITVFTLTRNQAR